MRKIFYITYNSIDKKFPESGRLSNLSTRIGLFSLKNRKSSAQSGRVGSPGWYASECHSSLYHTQNIVLLVYLQQWIIAGKFKQSILPSRRNHHHHQHLKKCPKVPANMLQCYWTTVFFTLCTKSKPGDLLTAVSHLWKIPAVYSSNQRNHHHHPHLVDVPSSLVIY